MDAYLKHWEARIEQCPAPSKAESTELKAVLKNIEKSEACLKDLSDEDMNAFKEMTPEARAEVLAQEPSALLKEGLQKLKTEHSGAQKGDIGRGGPSGR